MRPISAAMSTSGSRNWMISMARSRMYSQRRDQFKRMMFRGMRDTLSMRLPVLFKKLTRAIRNGWTTVTRKSLHPLEMYRCLKSKSRTQQVGMYNKRNTKPLMLRVTSQNQFNRHCPLCRFGKWTNQTSATKALAQGTKKAQRKS